MFVFLTFNNSAFFVFTFTMTLWTNSDVHGADQTWSEAAEGGCGPSEAGTTGCMETRPAQVCHDGAQSRRHNQFAFFLTHSHKQHENINNITWTTTESALATKFAFDDFGDDDDDDDENDEDWLWKQSPNIIHPHSFTNNHNHIKQISSNPFLQPHKTMRKHKEKVLN